MNVTEPPAVTLEFAGVTTKLASEPPTTLTPREPLTPAVDPVMLSDVADPKRTELPEMPSEFPAMDPPRVEPKLVLDVTFQLKARLSSYAVAE